MTVFCAVKNDRYEQICFIEDTLIRLAQVMGVSYQSIKGTRSRKQPIYGYKIVKVEIDDEAKNICEQSC